MNGHKEVKIQTFEDNLCQGTYPNMLQKGSVNKYEAINVTNILDEFVIPDQD